MSGEAAQSRQCHHEVRVGESGGLRLILGEHGVSGATYHLQVVVAALVRHLGVFIPGDVDESLNEDVVWMGRAKSRGFFPTPVLLEKLPNSNLLPVPVGISLTDLRRAPWVRREPPRPSPLL